MTDSHRRIYLLNPREYSPETIAVAFAKTSRSSEPFDQIAVELNAERSAEFHEKWVVGYGHSSVAEHAVLHLAMENISRLAVECVESNRLASFTEKSTRYQKWTADAYLTPPELAGTDRETAYRDACRALLQAYADSLEQVGELARRMYPRREGESDARWDGRIRVKYVDVCRYLLPAASLANVGVTINARALEHALRKMLSHPLEEVRAIGAEAKRVALAETPTLVKYADPNEYQRSAPAAFRAAFPPAPEDPAAAEPFVRLIAADPDSELRALAAAAVRIHGESFSGAYERLRQAQPAAREAACRALLEGRGAHDAPLRELEHIVFTFEAVMDQGAYFEVKRHRMMTQTPGPLTFDLGYAVPRWIEEAGSRASYEAALQRAENAYRRLRASNGPDVAAYLVPNACFRRLVFTLNAREAFHFCELRSSEAAHPAVRVLARETARQIGAAHPALAGFFRLGAPPDEGPDENRFLIGG